MGQTIATNKKAYRDFFFTETLECGIALKGAEVKSLRAGDVNFKDSFARIEKEEVFLYNLYIAPYVQASYLNEDSERKRKLLLHKKQVLKLLGSIAQKNVILVPTKIYFNNRGIAKVELALGKGKKSFDKRDTIKKRELDREIDRAIKNRQGKR